MQSDTETAQKQPINDRLQSFYRLRRAMGLVAFFLPFVLIAGGLLTESSLRDSVSNYYYSQMRDLFAGALVAIGIFLVSYGGYPRRTGEVFSDNVLSKIAGSSAILVALFPAIEHCDAAVQACPAVESITQTYTSFIAASWVHNLSAVVFFLCLAVFCFVQFPRTSALRRARIYKGCGYLIFVTLLVIAVAFVAGRWGGEQPAAFVAAHNIIFWAEAVGVWIFAAAWLTKGQADRMALSVMRSMQRR